MLHDFTEALQRDVRCVARRIVHTIRNKRVADFIAFFRGFALRMPQQMG
jgi:hypothetical protein